MTDTNKKACGVRLESGQEIAADVVLSCATPRITFEQLLAKDVQTPQFRTAIAGIDYTSPVTKINGESFSLLPTCSRRQPTTAVCVRTGKRGRPTTSPDDGAFELREHGRGQRGVLGQRARPVVEEVTVMV